MSAVRALHGILFEVYGPEKIGAWRAEADRTWPAILDAVQPRFGKDVYPTPSQKAARILYSGAKNHGLADGNKRLANYVMNAQLELCGFTLDDVPDEEMVAFVEAVAASPPDKDHRREVRRISKWINMRMRPVDH